MTIYWLICCTGKLCIEVGPASKVSFISEELCIGCGICVKKCPFDAIEIINLPKDLEKDAAVLSRDCTSEFFNSFPVSPDKLFKGNKA
ncbi:ABC transporter E family member 1-like isoform X7 [Hordeum vulgare subsp. vulgare]|uniref:ABC transporter E family member 1-like isoform X7 n=1 Tax=Hordeum vulgare subsp. vulgare TaxID=112509 RepID=UPI001D1A36FE|nr:ABC transporter E family member 1-like isoform X7 [Hordeum vulgare subsp. vulgare]